MVSEKNIEKSILQWLQYYGCLAIKINNMGVYDAQKKIYRKPSSIFIPSGISDIYFAGKNISGWLEVKTSKEYNFIIKNYDRLKNRDFNTNNKTYLRYHNQIMFLENVKSKGLIGIFVDNIDKLTELFSC